MLFAQMILGGCEYMYMYVSIETQNKKITSLEKFCLLLESDRDSTYNIDIQVGWMLRYSQCHFSLLCVGVSVLAPSQFVFVITHIHVYM